MSRNEAILLNSLVLTETQNCQPESNTQNEKENFIFIKFTNRAEIIFLTYSAIQIKKREVFFVFNIDIRFIDGYISYRFR